MGRRRALAALATQWLAVLLCAVLARSAETIPRIEVIEGEGAINNIRLHHAKEPVVRVVDQDGRPIPDAAVTFILPAAGASGTFDGKSSLTVPTDTNGQAVGKGLKPNSAVGQFQIRVTTSLKGMVATANISQTNAEPGGGGISSKTLLILAVVGGAAAAGAAVALKGKSSSTGTSPPAGVVITPGSPTIGPPK